MERLSLLAIAIVSIPAYARVMRASVLSVKEEEYTVAARTVGVSATQILFRHIIQSIGLQQLETTASQQSQRRMNAVRWRRIF